MPVLHVCERTAIWLFDPVRLSALEGLIRQLRFRRVFGVLAALLIILHGQVEGDPTLLVLVMVLAVEEAVVIQRTSI